MLQRLKLQAKSFFQYVFFSALLACILVYLCLQLPVFKGFIPYDISQYDLSISLISVMSAFLGKSAFVLLAAFTIISYEFLRINRTSHIDETLAAMHKGYRNTVRSQIAVLFFVAVAFGIAVCILCFSGIQIVSDQADFLPPAQFYQNTLYASILYGLLPSVIGIFLGYAWQRNKGRTAFYCFYAIFVFLSSRMAEPFYISVGGLALNADTVKLAAVGQKILDYCYRLQPVYNSFVNPTYGIGVEPYRWALAAFWIMLCLAAVLLRGKKWSAKASGLVCTVICAACALCVWVGGSDPLEYMAIPVKRHVVSDNMYYETARAQEAAPDFAVSGYEMDLKCVGQLHADVRCVLDGSMLPQYEFTLYHGYRLNRVTDKDGNALQYIRDCDYVTVINPNDTALTEIHFSYSGWHQELYSNAQGIFLPGYFCFYPIEGKYAVFENGFLSTAGRQLPERDYCVRVDANEPVFTNLPNTDGKTFSGSAVCLNIVSGMYRQEQEEETSYILPWCNASEPLVQTLAEEVAKLEREWGVKFPQPEYSTVIYSPTVLSPVPNRGTGICAAVGDVLLVGNTMSGADISNVLYTHCAGTLDEVPDGQIKTWFLQSLQAIIWGDSTGTQRFTEVFGYQLPDSYVQVGSMTDEENLHREVGFYLYKATGQTSPQYILNEMYRYLIEGKGVDDLTFAKALAMEG